MSPTFEWTVLIVYITVPNMGYIPSAEEGGGG